MNQELNDYVKRSREAGQNNQQIKNDLIKTSWKLEDIETSLSLPRGFKTKQVQLPGITDLFKRTWEVYKNKFRIFAGLILIYGFLLLIQELVGNLVEAVENSSLLLVLIVLILSIVTWIANYWMSIAVIYAVKDREENIGIKESLKRSWPKILSVIWISLLMSLIFFGGSALLIVPGIIFGVWFCFSNLIVITEDIRGMNALLKSKEYVKGNWWPIAWRILAGLAILGLGLTLAIGIIFVLGSLEMPSLLNSLSLPLIYILLLLVVVFFLTYSFLLYEDFKKLRTDLVFIPKRKERVLFSIIAILSILIIVVIPFLAIQYSPIPISSLWNRDNLSESELDAYIDSPIFDPFLEEAKNDPELREIVKELYSEKLGRTPTDEQVDAMIISSEFREVIKQIPELRAVARTFFNIFIPALEILDEDLKISQESSSKLQTELEKEAGVKDSIADRDNRRVSDLKQVQVILEIYHSKFGYYPKDYKAYGDWNSWAPLKGALKSADFDISKFPEDPRYKDHYGYGVRPDGQSYVLKAFFEDRNHPALQTDLDGIVYGLTCDALGYCIKYP